MTIHELLQAAGLTANDEIPIWDVDGTGEPTKKITAQQLAAAVVALANLVTGVKGNSEQNYRQGDVNLTPADIGAVAKSGDMMTGILTTLGLIAQSPNDTGVIARCNQSGVMKGDIWLDSHPNGNQGLWSSGYYNGSEYISDPKWLILRDTSGNVKLQETMMEGPLKWKDGNALSSATTLDYFLGIDSFTDGGTTRFVTANNLRTSIGAAAVSEVTHMYIDASLIDFPLDTSSYFISFETVGKNAYITFRGESRAHAENEVFMVIPEGFRSAGTRFFPAVINNVGCGVVMNSNGNVSIWSPNPPSGRIFLAMSYCIE